MTTRRGPEPWEPTPEEIAAACEAIQRDWTPADFLRRRAPERPVDMTTVHRVVGEVE